MDPLNPRPERRRVCPRCERPRAVCLCHVIPEERMGTKTHVMIIQHPHEARHKLSTVPVLTKCLLNATTIVARRLRKGISPLLDKHPNAIYLFPSTPSSKALTIHHLSDPLFHANYFSHPDHNLTSPRDNELHPAFLSGKLEDPNENSSCRSENVLHPGFLSGKLEDPDENSSFGSENVLHPGFLSAKLEDPDENSSFGRENELNPDGKWSSSAENVSGKLSRPVEILSSRMVKLTNSSGSDDDSGSGLETELDPEFFLGKLGPGENRSSSEPDESSMPKLVLIAFDATWKHAKEMVSASEKYLSRFATRVCLDTDEGVDGASIYNSELVLRKEPFGGCVSTMEAVARCLRVIEHNGVEIEGMLVGVLREMVRLQAGFLRPLKPRVKLVKRGKERDLKKED